MKFGGGDTVRAVPKTRNLGTMTEAQYRQRIRSALRECFKWWKPAQEALKQAKVQGRTPVAYRCAKCKGVFLRKQVQIDHIVPCGKLVLEELHLFIARMCPEDPKAFQVLCCQCHDEKTKEDNTVAKMPGLFD